MALSSVRRGVLLCALAALVSTALVSARYVHFAHRQQRTSGGASDGSDGADPMLQLREDLDPDAELARGPAASRVLHVWWAGFFGRKQALSLKSALAVHSALLAGPERWRAVVWLDTRGGWYARRSESPWLAQVLSARGAAAARVLVLPYDPLRMSAGTPYEAVRAQADEQRGPVQRRADWARMIVLHRYGGLYFDLDCLWLRSAADEMRAGDFMYQWASRPRLLNNALAYLVAGGEAERNITGAAVAQKKPGAIWGLSAMTVAAKPEALRLLDWRRIDWCWLDKHMCPGYDFRWLFAELDGERQRYVDRKMGESLVYHWHNLWKERIHNRSTFAAYEKLYDEQLGVTAHPYSDA
eukprot:m51a1_g148 hypothetical protein (355) ;mRNA; r:472967-474031